jgi:hypothetical protein
MTSAARIQRERQTVLDDTVDRLTPFAEDCSAAILATTTTVATYPTSASAFYAINPTDAGGTETEGGTASFTAGSAILYALNVGTQIPPNGAKIVVHAVGGRYVFRYDG